MKTFITKSKTAGDKTAFKIIKNLILKKPDSLIGFAVGKTTDGLYKLITNDVLKNPKTWSKLKLFQIDENLGKGPESKLSFNNEIIIKLKSLINQLNPKNIFLIDGLKKSKTIITNGYRFIKNNKGIDLIILGLGPEYDPHIAYNTKGKSNINSGFRVVSLHSQTIKKLRGKLKSICGTEKDKVTPTKGITLGIKDILETRKALLIAYGKEKAKSLHIAFNRKVDTKKSSASALQLHKNLIVVTDKEAGKYLT